MSAIPLIVAARNEAASLASCLPTLQAAVAAARASDGASFLGVVVGDDCTDATLEVAESAGFAVLRSSGGKVEAQRRGLEWARAQLGKVDFAVFADADILVPETCLTELVRAMREPGTLAAYPRKLPLPPRSATVLAHAIHSYNLRQGFASKSTWFSGKLFALRGWDIPLPEEMARRAAGLPPDPFLALDAPMRVDDVFLSRAAIARGGIRALRQVDVTIRYRAPETWLGMMRTYRRMRREIERMDLLFPEQRAVASTFGQRRYDALPKPFERAAMDLAVFWAALLLCKVGYRAERALSRAVGRGWDPWPAIEETKLG